MILASLRYVGHILKSSKQNHREGYPYVSLKDTENEDALKLDIGTTSKQLFERARWK